MPLTKVSAVILGDQNKLVDLENKEVLYTWSNGMSLNSLIEIRLDRVLSNQDWLSDCLNMTVLTLLKLRWSKSKIPRTLSLF